jgi:(R,R)-butanediol dehydrogenase/meso-butanediol dehydrogenase/diacetyl reductase
VRAAVFQGVGLPLKVTSVPDARSSADSVIISVTRAGICASEIHMTEQTRPDGSPVLRPGAVLGHEFAGTVVEVGAQVRDIAAGDVVAVHAMVGCGHCENCAKREPWWCLERYTRGGGYAEYASVREDSCTRLSPLLSPAEGALVEPLASSLHAVNMIPANASSVLVLGLGAIGLGSVFWARKLGSVPVVAVARSDRRLELARRLGLNGFAASSDDRAVTALLGGPPDVVIECIGQRGTFSAALDAVAPRGTVIVASACMEADSVTHVMAVRKELTIRYSAAYSVAEFEATAVALESEKVLAEIVTATVGFDALSDAYEELRHGKRASKVLLDPYCQN